MRYPAPTPVPNLRGDAAGFVVYLEDREFQPTPGEPVSVFLTSAEGYEAVKAARASMVRLAEIVSAAGGRG